MACEYVLPESTLEIIRTESEVRDSGEIAGVLNGMGLKSARGMEFTRDIVLKTMRTNGIPTCEKRMRQRGYMSLPEKAGMMGIPWRTLYRMTLAGEYTGEYARAGEKGKFMFL